MASSVRKIWIDTDGGVDDALALACAYRVPSICVAGISTVFGNVAPRKAARNAALVQALVGGEACPVLCGADAPLQGRWQHARSIHGEDGVGGASVLHRLDYEDRVVEACGPAGVAEAMARFARHTGAGGTIVCIGPLSNLAQALVRDADAFLSLGSIVVMGGALSVPRARRGGFEFNFGSDLEAARLVLEKAPRLKIITLNLCREVVLRRYRLQQMTENAPDRLNAFLRRAHQHYMDAYKASEGIDGCYPHDALALAAAVKPDLVELETRRVALSETGEFPGLLVANEQARPVQLGVGLHHRKALDWIADCLAGISPH